MNERNGSSRPRPQERADRAWLPVLAGLLAGCAAPARDASPGLLGTGSATPEAESRPIAGPQKDGGGGDLPIHGKLSTRYRHRARSGESDDDLYATLSLAVGDARRHRVTGHLMGRGAWNLEERDADDVFFDNNDIFDDQLTGRLYFAYVDVHRVPRLERLRLGRQQLWKTPELVTFDGISLESEETTEADLKLGLYGGLPTRHYESSSSGDRILGSWLESQPWKGGRVRLDWMHLKDEARLGESENDLYSVGMWQSLSERLRVDGHYGRLDDKDRDARAAVSWYDPELDLLAQTSYYELLEPQQALSNELDPFFNSLHTLFPFSQTGALVSKGLGQRARLQLGADLRRVDNSGDEGPFNNDFDRWFATASLFEFLAEGLSLHVTGDRWDSLHQDVESVGFELQKEVNARLSLGLGTYYSLYKINLFLDQQRDNVRTWFVKARFDRSANRRFDIAYEYEDDETFQYHVIRLGATWRF